MGKSALALFALLVITGCSMETREQALAAAERQCQEAGLQIGTPAYARCVDGQFTRRMPRNRSAIDPNGDVIILE